MLALVLVLVPAGSAGAHAARRLLTEAAPPAPGAGEVPTPGTGEANAPEACSITLVPLSPSLHAGEAATLNGTLTCPEPAAAARQTVTIEQRVAGTRGITLAGSATTDEAGGFSFTTASGLERLSSFWAEALGARSARTRVLVSAGAVTLTGPAPAGSELPLLTRRARLDATATQLAFHGTVTPSLPGARVILQRQSRRRPEVWRPIARGLVQADGSYTLLHSFSVSGPATVRVVVRTRGLHATVSEALTYKIASRRSSAFRAG